MTPYSRTDEFERLPLQEEVLQEVNDLLGRAEHGVYPPSGAAPELPLVLIVGPLRSGTTLTLQWLAASGAFAYPTNILARFFGAPYLGSRIQQLLTDPRFDYHNELTGRSDAALWTSDVGKTSGMLQPHEFFYFWRRFFPVDQAQQLTEAQLTTSDPTGFAAGWALIEKVFDKPVAAKGILLQYDIGRLAEWLPTAIFLHTRRDPFFNMQSVLSARKRVFGTEEAWFSVRPPEYSWLKDEDVYTQIAGQVLFTNRSIEKELSLLPLERSLSVEYEAFCKDPGDVWHQLRGCLSAQGFELPGEYEGPKAFESTNEARCSPAEEKGLRDAFDRLAIAFPS